MNLDKLREAGFSDTEIQDHVARKHVSLKSAGFSDAEIEAKYGPNPASPPNPVHFDFDKTFDEIQVKDASDVMVGTGGTPQPVVDALHDNFVKPWMAVGYTGAESFNRGMAGFATHLDTVADYIQKKTGMEKGGMFKATAETFNKNRDYWKKRADEVGVTFLQELVGEAAGGAMPGITEFLLNVPYAGILGAAEAKDGESELGAALVAMAKRGVLGAVFHAIGPLNNYLRAPMFGTVFGAQAAFEGGEPRDIAKAAGTGLLFSASSPGGRYGLNELSNNLRDSFRKTERLVENVRAAEMPETMPVAGMSKEVPSGKEGQKAEGVQEVKQPWEMERTPGTVVRAVSKRELDAILETGEIKSESSLALPVEKKLGLTAFAENVKDTKMYAAQGEDYYIIEVKSTPEMRKDYGNLPSILTKRNELTKELEQVKRTLEEKGTGWENAAQFREWEKKNTQDIEALNEQLKDAGIPESQLEGVKSINLPYPMTPKAVSASNITKIMKIDAGGVLADVTPKTSTGSASPGMAPEKDFRRQPEGKAEAEKPMGRSDIKEFLEEKLNQTIRVGRFNTKGALGVFKSGEEVVRTKNANDIEVIAHEIGHAIHKFLWPETIKATGFSAQPFTAYKGELDPIATKPKAGASDITSEGFAEFMRLYVTDAPQAQAKAPTFFSYFEAQLDLKAPEVKAILLEARKKYDLFMKQPALKRVLSQVSVGENPQRKTNTFDELYTMAVDDLHPLEKVVKEMAQGQKLSPSQDPYKLARLMKGWTGKAEAFLKNKPFEYGTLKDVPNSKSLKEILDPIRDNLDEFRAYVISKRALELAGRDIETGILKADAEAIVKDYEGKFKTTFADLKKYQDQTLKYLQDAGILKPDAIEAMRQANNDYVPFYRVMEDTKGYGVGRGLQAYDPVKGIKGSWRDIVDPLESVIKNTFTYINLAEKNAVGRALVDLANKQQGMGKFVEKIPTPMRGIEVKTEELTRWLKENGLEGDLTKDQIDALTVFRPNAFTPKDNVISVWKDGKRELYQVHPDVARTFQALDAETTNVFLRLLSKPASWLRAGATLTPEFIGRNPARDQWGAFINSKYGFIPGFDTVRGIFSMAKKDDLYWNWKKGGGDHSMLVSMDRDYLQDNLGDLLQQYPVRNRLKNPINALRMLSELGEAGTRLGEMAAAQRKLGTGKEGIQESAFASREVTLDFNRAGAKTKAVNALIAFWNANVQGTDKIVRAFKDNPLGTSVKVAASITLPSVLLAIATHDDPRLKEVPQWQKDLFWVIPTDTAIWRIPKPFEMGILFGSVPERITHFILDQDPKAFDKVLESIGRGFVPGMVPTIMQPIMENWANKSTFFDRAIVAKSREGLLPEYQYNEYTTETAKQLGAIVGKFPGMQQSSAASPAYIENLVRGWTGGLGKYALDIADAGLKAAGVNPDKYEKPSKTLADIPFVKAFVVRYPTSSSASIERFYENYEKAKAVEKTVKVLMEKEQDPEKAIRLWQQSGGADLDGMNKALGSIRHTIDLVYRNPDMTGDEKRELIDTMYLQMIQIAQQGNYVSDEFEKVMKQYR